MSTQAVNQAVLDVLIIHYTDLRQRFQFSLLNIMRVKLSNGDMNKA